MDWTIKIPENVLGNSVTSKVISIQGKIYSLNFDETTFEDDIDFFRVHQFDKEIDKWVLMKYPNEQNYEEVPPVCYQGLNPVSWDKYAFLWGGFNSFEIDGFGDYFDKLYRFDSEKCLWDTPEVYRDIPVGMEYHILAVVNGKLYVIGGNFGGSMKTFVLDLNTFIWTSIQTENFYFICSPNNFVTQDRLIYFFGKMFFEGEVFLKFYLCCFDTESCKFSYEKTTTTSDLDWIHNINGFYHIGLNYILAEGNRDNFYYTYNPTAKSLKRLTFPNMNGHIQGVVKEGNKIQVFVSGTIPKNLLDEIQWENLTPTQRENCDFILAQYLPFDLKTLCTSKVVKCNLNTSELPKDLQEEIAKF